MKLPVYLTPRRIDLGYEAPGVCDLIPIFTGTGEEITLPGLSFRTRYPVSGFYTLENGVLRFYWNAYKGALCYTVYYLFNDPYGPMYLAYECLSETQLERTEWEDDFIGIRVDAITPEGTVFAAIIFYDGGGEEEEEEEEPGPDPCDEIEWPSCENLYPLPRNLPYLGLKIENWDEVKAALGFRENSPRPDCWGEPVATEQWNGTWRQLWELGYLSYISEPTEFDLIWDDSDELLINDFSISKIRIWGPFTGEDIIGWCEWFDCSYIFKDCSWIDPEKYYWTFEIQVTDNYYYSEDCCYTGGNRTLWFGVKECGDLPTGFYKRVAWATETAPKCLKLTGMEYVYGQKGGEVRWGYAWETDGLSISNADYWPVYLPITDSLWNSDYSLHINLNFGTPPYSVYLIEGSFPFEGFKLDVKEEGGQYFIWITEADYSEWEYTPPGEYSGIFYVEDSSGEIREFGLTICIVDLHPSQELPSAYTDQAYQQIPTLTGLPPDVSVELDYVYHYEYPWVFEANDPYIEGTPLSNYGQWCPDPNQATAELSYYLRWET